MTFSVVGTSLSLKLASLNPPIPILTNTYFPRQKQCGLLILITLQMWSGTVQENASWPGPKCVPGIILKFNSRDNCDPVPMAVS